MLDKAKTEITESNVEVFTVPTDAPEADGTYAWDSTTMVLVVSRRVEGTWLHLRRCRDRQARVHPPANSRCGPRCFLSRRDSPVDLYRHLRNLGETGITTMAVAAIDNALWDLRARLLDMPLVRLLGMVRDGIPVYGSGGFTSYSDDQLQRQLGGGCSAAIPW